MEGKDIRRIRKEILKWSMEKFAREIGVALATIYNWETGRSKPSYLGAEKIKRILDERSQRLVEQPGREKQNAEILLSKIRKKDKLDWEPVRQQMLPLRIDGPNQKSLI